MCVSPQGQFLDLMLSSAGHPGPLEAAVTKSVLKKKENHHSRWSCTNRELLFSAPIHKADFKSLV